MIATLHVFDAAGRRLGILEHDHIGSVSRQMPFNGRQSESFDVPRDLATGNLLRFGNLVVVESDSGVELWGGVVRGRRSWRFEGPSLPVQTWETLLQGIPTSSNAVYRGMSAGRAAISVLQSALETYSLPIVIGNVTDAGPTVEREPRGSSTYDAIVSLQRDADDGFDWWVETIWDQWQSRPQGVFNLVPRAGRNTGLLISEGLNVDNVNRSDDDERAVTQATVIASGGRSWEERPQATESDATLLDTLQWPRITVDIRNDLHTSEAARETARGLLSGPMERLTVGITNDGGEWATIRNGDTVLCNLPSYQFSDEHDVGGRRHRAVGRTVDEKAGVQTLQLVQED